MRTSIAVVLAIVMLFTGVTMLSIQSESVQPTVDNSTNQTQDVFNMTNNIYEGVREALTPAVVWMGVIAFVLVASGFLVAVGMRGR